MLKALKKVRKGQYPSAAQQNEQTLAIEGLRNMSGFGGATISIAEYGVSIDGNDFLQLAINGVIVQATNASEGDTASDVYAGEVVQMNDLPNDLTEINQVFKDQTPEFSIPAAGSLHRMGVVLDEIKQNSSGPVMVSGRTFVKVIRHEDYVDVEYKYANPRVDVVTLTMEGYGLARVLWEQEIDDMEDEHWAWIEFPTVLPQLWEATGDAADNEITAKRVSSDGTLVGDDVTFYAMG